MKDHVDLGHLTKYDAFRVNRDQVMDLEIWFKIHTNVSNLERASPKTIKTPKIFHQFCDNCKIPSCNFYSKEAELKIAMFANFKDYHGNHKNFKSLYGFGGRCLRIKDVCIDFEAYFKVHSLVSNSSSAQVSREKTKTQALMNFFFPLEIVRGTYMNLYSFESSMK